ncbi:hypothetical protein [Sphingomonas sp. PAMC 26605]|uniref:hypothetical protein n=1 Tax=Sphingomonas sp. PAMC 26605 TaxID=1112214 RepID=UPI00026CCBA5|nr:hypothetical protein [Sphingomonas sp. PAMC 26605]
MKIAALISAGLIAAAALVPAAASAQIRHDRVVTRSVHSERHGFNRHRTRKVCTMRYRNHHRVRVCRTVRS